MSCPSILTRGKIGVGTFKIHFHPDGLLHDSDASRHYLTAVGGGGHWGIAHKPSRFTLIKSRLAPRRNHSGALGKGVYAFQTEKGDLSTAVGGAVGRSRQQTADPYDARKRLAAGKNSSSSRQGR